MIQNRVYKVKQMVTLPNNLILKEGQELEIVMDCVYMNGFPLPPEMQASVYNFIQNNKTSFEDVTRQW